MHVSMGRNDQHQRWRTATSAACRCPPQFAVRLLDRLEGDQFGELARDICLRIFCSVQAASRAEQKRTGVSARTSAGVYATAEPIRDHLGLPLLPDPPTLLR